MELKSSRWLMELKLIQFPLRNYFGTESIVNDLMKLSGWSQGLISITSEMNSKR